MQSSKKIPTRKLGHTVIGIKFIAPLFVRRRLDFYSVGTKNITNIP